MCLITSAFQRINYIGYPKTKISLPTMYRCLILPALLASLPLLSQQNNLYKAFHYQAVARDANGEPIPNQSIGLKFELVAGIGLVYSETQTVTTNDLGLFVAQVGEGVPEVGFGPLVEYTWYHPANDMKLVVQADFSGGTDYQTFGPPVDLRAVPVAASARMATTLLDSSMVVDINGGVIDVAPGYDLRVQGTLTYPDGNEGVGRVLVSDATGTASWQEPQQRVIHQVDNEPASSYVERPMYVMELSDSWPANTSKALPDSILNAYCGDLDGCRITLLALQPETGNNFHFVRRGYMTYSTPTGRMEIRTETTTGVSSTSSFSTVLLDLGEFCRFQTRSVIAGTGQPADDQLHLLKGTSSTVDRCVLRIED